MVPRPAGGSGGLWSEFTAKPQLAALKGSTGPKGFSFEDLHEKDLHGIGSIREWHSLVVILQHSFAAAPFNTSVVASVVHLTVALSATEVV